MSMILKKPYTWLRKIVKRFLFILLLSPIFANDVQYVGIVGYCPCKLCCNDSLDRSSYKDGDIIAPIKFPIGTMIYIDNILLGTVKHHYPKDSKTRILKRFFLNHSNAKAFHPKILVF